MVTGRSPCSSKAVSIKMTDLSHYRQEVTGCLVVQTLWLELASDE